MAKSESAGILLFRRRSRLEVLLAHPGGPFWAKKDAGAWTIPKGGLNPGEDVLAAARREFAEETGYAPPGEPIALGSIRQRSGKIVHAFAIEGDFDPAKLVSNTTELEWPPRSGRTITIPEIDRAAWLAIDEAREKILPAQAELLARLESALAAP